MAGRVCPAASRAGAPTTGGFVGALAARHLPRPPSCVPLCRWPSRGGVSGRRVRRSAHKRCNGTSHADQPPLPFRSCPRLRARLHCRPASCCSAVHRRRRRASSTTRPPTECAAESGGGPMSSHTLVLKRRCRGGTQRQNRVTRTCGARRRCGRGTRQRPLVQRGRTALWRWVGAGDTREHVAAHVRWVNVERRVRIGHFRQGTLCHSVHESVALRMVHESGEDAMQTRESVTTMCTTRPLRTRAGRGAGAGRSPYVRSCSA